MRRRNRMALLAAPLLLFSAALAWLASFDVDSYHDDITAWLSATTGRAVTIGSGVELDLLPVPELRLRDLRLANTVWGSGESALVVDRLDLRVALLPLLQGRLVVPRAVLSGVELDLERNADGAVNWRYGDGGADTASGGMVRAPVLVFDGIRVNGLRIRYRDALRDKRLQLDLRELSIASPTLEEPLTAHGRGEVAGAALEFSLQVQTLAALRAQRETTLALLLDLDDIRLRLNGTLPATASGGTIALDVDLQAPSLGRLVDMTARVLPAAASVAELAPRMMALAPITLTSRLSWPDADSARLDDLRLRTGKSSLDGWMRVQTGQRMRLDGVLTTPLLVLADLAGEDGGAGSGRVFSDTPLPWESLDAIDVGLVIEAAELRLGGNTLTDVELSLGLLAGEAMARPRFAQAGGVVRGELRASAAGRRLRIELEGDGIDLGRLQRELGAGADVRDALTSFSIALSGAGASAHELAASMDGRVLVQVGAARVRSGVLAFASGDLLLQVARELGLGDDDDMKLECAVANLDVKDGIARSGSGVGLRFERANVIGGGSVDLGAETLDLNLALEPREGVGLSLGSTLAGMIAIRGTLMEPVVEARAEGVAVAGAKVGAALLTGGLSVLAGALFDRVTATVDACETALSSGVGVPTPQPEARAGSVPATQEVVRPRSRRNDD